MLAKSNFFVSAREVASAMPLTVRYGQDEVRDLTRTQPSPSDIYTLCKSWHVIVPAPKEFLTVSWLAHTDKVASAAGRQPAFLSTEVGWHVNPGIFAAPESWVNQKTPLPLPHWLAFRVRMPQELRGNWHRTEAGRVQSYDDGYLVAEPVIALWVWYVAFMFKKIRPFAGALVITDEPVDPLSQIGLMNGHAGVTWLAVRDHSDNPEPYGVLTYRVLKRKKSS